MPFEDGIDFVNDKVYFIPHSNSHFQIISAVAMLVRCILFFTRKLKLKEYINNVLNYAG